MTIIKYLISWNDDPTDTRDSFFNFNHAPAQRCLKLEIVRGTTPGIPLPFPSYGKVKTTTDLQVSTSKVVMDHLCPKVCCRIQSFDTQNKTTSNYVAAESRIENTRNTFSSFSENCWAARSWPQLGRTRARHGESQVVQVWLYHSICATTNLPRSRQ